MCSILPASISTLVGFGIATPAVLTGGWIKPETHFPSSLYRFIPHTPFDTIEKALSWVAQTGFGAILLPALHAPSTVSIDGRRGSAYAPRYIMGISPVMSGLTTPREYLADGKDGKPRTIVFCHREEPKGRRGDPVKSITSTGLPRHFVARNDIATQSQGEGGLREQPQYNRGLGRFPAAGALAIARNETLGGVTIPSASTRLLSFPPFRLVHGILPDHILPDLRQNIV